ncbi:signal peptidase I [Bacteroides sp.]|uniref:signal peptidase I n=1 Tax=Bacteroides sp. TaxID=29523 RepID=UPI00258A667E|nr:signal peptidase I [Bacteroides sp.]
MKRGVKWVLTVFGVILVIGLLRSLLFASCYIPASGMENNLKQGDCIIVNRWSYGLRIPFSKSRIFSQTANKGDILLFNNPVDTSTDKIYQKELYISRCIGLPGDTLLVDSLFLSHESSSFFNPDQRSLYSIYREHEPLIDSIFLSLKIQRQENVGEDDGKIIKSLSAYEYYLLEQKLGTDTIIYPLENKSQNLHPLFIPKKDVLIKIEPWNRVLLFNTILLHEKQNIIMKENQLYINGQIIQEYQFTQDYYWMSSNNSLNLSDSRQFGFVPHSHLIGKASFIWFSKDPNHSLFSGYRWNRIFKSIY